jgi:carbon monoxide dehydrogenase subunit G
MSPFTVERKLSASKKINVPLSTALRALHDPVVLIDTGPLVIDYKVDPNDPDLYEITDSISLGYFRSKTKFKAKFTRMEDGVIVDVYAGFGTNIKAYWRAKSIDDGTQVDVDTSVKALFILAPYITGTLRTTRPESLEKLAAAMVNQEPPSISRCRYSTNCIFHL